MGRERYIYPNEPDKWTWEGYRKCYPLSSKDMCEEEQIVAKKIDELKLKLFGLVGATPRDITNENDDPVDYICSLFNNIIDDMYFLVKKQWHLFMINNYQSAIDEGKEDNLVGTVDEHTNRPWKPYIYIVGMYASSEYSCDDEIDNNKKVADMLTQELMMYVMGTPSDICKDDTSDNTSTDDMFFRVRDILSNQDGIEYYWWQMFDWEFARDNWNDESYNSY